MALRHTSMEKTIAARSLKASHLLILGAWIPGEENAPIRARNHVCYSKQCVCVCVF